MTPKLKICILGPTCVGKTTLCNELARGLSLFKIGIGQYLRELNDSELNEKMRAGEDISPDIWINKYRADARIGIESELYNGWISDGCPRNESEFNKLNEYPECLPNIIIILLADKEQITAWNLSRNRFDQSAAEKRLKKWNTDCWLKLDDWFPKYQIIINSNSVWNMTQKAVELISEASGIDLETLLLR